MRTGAGLPDVAERSQLVQLFLGDGPYLGGGGARPCLPDPVAEQPRQPVGRFRLGSREVVLFSGVERQVVELLALGVWRRDQLVGLRDDGLSVLDGFGAEGFGDDRLILALVCLCEELRGEAAPRPRLCVDDVPPAKRSGSDQSTLRW